ncbi:putative TonB-dependent receptor [Saliniradius amylolyticus]|uniref:Putative TonB-dependent receptor n=1 Tax=Saliniradius amylolyticus TaxID=2183582 RepID=A0A2S2E896_9ALTE|nr:TonB-dependent receptor [Saliniradius amylolyticus]AWL13167.1 putative TonB-dependent receptor [Saliniradius amylolyticus]
MTFKQLSPIMLALASSYSIAQDKPTQRDEHNVETLIIKATPLKRTALETATPVSVLSGEELDQNLAATLGETLNTTPGVHSSYFGPVSSSPVIRGLDGPRIKVVQNGLDASDASRVGPDHAVATEASTATQVEVLRGPATLLYGSGAIGGVVNVVDNRLPQQQQSGLNGEMTALYDDVSNERTVSADINGGAGEFVWHADAFDRQTNDYKIPVPAEDEGTHHDEAGHDETPSEQETFNGRLENSFIDAQGVTLGAGWINDEQRLAFSYGRLENDYGIPGHSHAHEEEAHADEELNNDDDHGEEESVFARMKQDRIQAVGDWYQLGEFIDSVHWHNGYTDYQHSEIENGAVGTTFENDTLESRLWLEHKAIAGWQGAWGLHYKQSDFAAVGEEAFTPATDTETQALFVLEEKAVGSLLWQLGARVEQVSHQPDNAFFSMDHHDHEEGHAEEEHGNVHFEQADYTVSSFSVGAVWQLDDNRSLSANFARSERAPSAAEIFSNGPHIGTGTFEIGGGFEIHQEGKEYHLEQSETEMNKETASNLDLTYRHRGDHFTAAISLFYNQVDDYIFQQDTGLFISDGELHGDDEHEGEHADEHDGEEGHIDHGADLPVFLYAQQDADLYGFEAELDWHLNAHWRMDFFSDYTRAELDSGDNVPRIPPLRLGATAHFEYGSWHGELGAVRYSKQDRVAPFETHTDGYTLVSASVNYYLQNDFADMTFFIKGDNLTDEEARVHNSFIKDVAPRPGRSISLGVRASF